jgi:predicted DNA repair protein MutK
MAGTSLLALIDDIASILDDISLMTKLAAKKTTGVLGDDLALNAQQVTGIDADRELPVVWAVAKGSLRNKLILVPSALAISAITPWAVTPLLMIGGIFLCFEGFEKIAEKFLHDKQEETKHEAELVEALVNPDIDLADIEKEKIKGAIRTDLILSAEIITITLGIVATSAFGVQVMVLASVGVIMTFAVYGIVAGIVKLDDGGLYLSRVKGEKTTKRIQRSIGNGVLQAAPYLMKGLSIAGTIAMFMVGGGILAHGTPGVTDVIHTVEHSAGKVPGIGAMLESITLPVLDALFGLLAGGIALVIVTLFGKALKAFKGKK